MKEQDLRHILDSKYRHYDSSDFIPMDPISLPHQFSKQQDIEIAGLFAAVFAWGQRPTILAKGAELFSRMDHTPHDFVLNHSDKDLQRLLGFRHRTFNDTDLLYFVSFLHHHYSKENSLESAFTKGKKYSGEDTGEALIHFRDYFFGAGWNHDFPLRTQKHISSPASGSACKRLNMYLRWMVRKDRFGVDFGLWKQIQPRQLICPLDLHVGRVARKLGLLNRPQDDWKAAVELTERLRTFDAADPVKYDFALFGMGAERVM